VKTVRLPVGIQTETGAILKQGRTNGALGEYFASPVAAGGRIYAVSCEGKLTVLKAGSQWEILATNEFGEEVFATPAIGDGRLLVRTRGHLYSFGGASGGRNP
jgi:outer membrane protein assembly factor BamB